MCDIEMILELATVYRYAIDKAVNEHKLTRCGTLEYFPRECCDITCDLLGQYLHEKHIESYQINGQNRHNSTERHVWLRTESGIIVDITADQFQGRFKNVGWIEKVIVGEETKIHRIFNKNRIREEHTQFKEPNKFRGFGMSPSYRQKILIKASEIIGAYL